MKPLSFHSARVLLAAALLGMVAGISTASVQIAITYTDAAGTGFNDPNLGAARRQAFEFALANWSPLLNGNIPIQVKAGWASLSDGVLAQAGPTTSYENFSGAPLANTYYVPGLAKQISGEDLNHGGTDFQITYNTKTTNWYYGIDSNPPGDQEDFVTVTMHELGHGLGFTSSIAYADPHVTDGTWYGGDPNSFDQWLTDIDGWRFVNRTPADRAPDIVSGNRLYFMGPLTYAQPPTSDFGHHAPLYCPTTYSGGSSVSHMGEPYNTWNGGSDALMTYSLSNGEVHHFPGYIGLSVFGDIGWAAVQPLTLSMLDPISTTHTVTFRAVVNMHGHPGTVFFHWVSSLGQIGDTPAVNVPGDNADHEIDATVSNLPAGDSNGFHPTVIADNERSHLEQTLPNFGFVMTKSPGSGTDIEFNGLNTVVQTTGLSGLGTGNAPHTVEAWLYPTAYPASSAGVLMLGNQASGSENWFLRNDGILVIGTFGGIVSGFTLPLNTWTHVADTYDGINHRMYVNGNFLGIFGNTLNVQGNTLTVGGGQPGVPGYFQGFIDEVRVWNVQRSQGEIAANIYKTATDTEPNLVNEWRFDESTGFTVNDSSGHSAPGHLSDNEAWAGSDAPIGIPLVVTGTATGIGGSSATLNGTVDPNTLSTGAQFQWGTSTSYTELTPPQALSGNGAQPIHEALTGLSPNTIYHFRIVATNEKASEFSADQTFKTLGAAATTSLPATNVSTSSATLNGTVNPNSADTSVTFDWGATASYGSTTPAQTVPAGSADVPVSFPLNTGTLPAGVYHYRVTATNANGAASGDDQTFTLLSPTAGTALQLDGMSGSAVMSGAPTNLNLFPLTVSAWIKTLDTTGVRGIINKYASNSDNGYQLFLSSGHLAAWYFRDASSYVYGGSDMSLDGGLVADGHWHHVAFTVDTDGGKVYVDGQLKNQLAWTGTPGITTTTQPLSLGVYPGPDPLHFFNGQMDEVSVWHAALSQTQIQQFMGHRLQGTEPNLMAYYRLDDASGTAVTDALGANNGTLQGNAQWVPSDAFDDRTPVTGSALLFDGFDGAVRIPNFGQVAPTSEITIEFWENVNSPKKQSTFVTSPADSANIINAHVPWEDGTVYWDFGSETGGGRLTYTPPDSYFGVWQHWAMVASQENGGYMAIYRNGVQVAYKTGANQFHPGAYDLMIGGVPDARFGGSLDEFRIWNVARTQAEIQSTMYQTLTGNEPGLYRYYRMDENAGPAINDPLRSAASPSGDTVTGYLLPGVYWTPSTILVGAPYSIDDAARALSIAGGLSAYQPSDARLNVEISDPHITVADPLRIARRAAGLDANP